VETITGNSLVLIGPNIPHCWTPPDRKAADLIEISIHWQPSFLDVRFVKGSQLHSIAEMFSNSYLNGFSFPEETVAVIARNVIQLSKNCGFGSFIDMLNILTLLSKTQTATPIIRNSLPSEAKINAEDISTAQRIIEHLNNHCFKPLKQSDVANQADLSSSSLSKFMKRCTGLSYSQTLSAIRIGHAERQLIETDKSIEEISISCGFTNLSNFNRIFKKRKGCSPTDYRKKFKELRTFV
jgi:AraC-like DNA-binding protein